MSSAITCVSLETMVYGITAVPFLWSWRVAFVI